MMERIVELWDRSDVESMVQGLLQAIEDTLRIRLTPDFDTTLFDNGDVLSYPAQDGYRLTLLRLGRDTRMAVVESGALEDPVQHAHFAHQPFGWVESDAYGGVV